MKKEGRKE